MTARVKQPTPLRQSYYDYGIMKFGKHHPWIKQITNKINRGEIVLIPDREDAMTAAEIIQASLLR